MTAVLKAEFLKLFTIRSTYILFVITLVIIGGLNFYFEGFRGNTGSAASMLQPEALKEVIINSAGLAVTFSTIIAILFVAHEYRYNMIMYTLTSTARRTKVLLAKSLTISIFGAIFGALVTIVGVCAYLLGVALRDGASLPAQDIDIAGLAGKLVIYFVAYVLIGLTLALLVRSVVATIAIFLIFPTTIEMLLGLVLKDNAKYLPFSALESVAGNPFVSSSLSFVTAALVVAAYIAGIWLIAWALFVRRDAN